MQTIPASPQTKRQGGYTIVELSIALTVIAILIVAGLSGVNSLLLSSKANSQIEDSGRALAKLQAILTSTQVSGITTASANGMGLFPSSRVTVSGTTTTVTNVLGGREFVASNTATITEGTLAANGAVIYSLTAIPKAVCSDIASSLAAISNSAYVSTAITGTTDITTVPTASTALIKSPGGVPQGAVIGTACNSADTVGMAFVLRP
jgi:prepilin-type N-terminal cleavage/methylation domain-containing protein